MWHLKTDVVCDKNIYHENNVTDKHVYEVRKISALYINLNLAQFWPHLSERSVHGFIQK